MGCGSSTPPSGQVRPISGNGANGGPHTITVAKYQTLTIEPAPTGTAARSPQYGHGTGTGTGTGTSSKDKPIEPASSTIILNDATSPNNGSPGVSARGSGSGSRAATDASPATTATTTTTTITAGVAHGGHRPTPSNGLLELPSGEKRRGSSGSEPASARSQTTGNNSPHNGNGTNGSSHNGSSGSARSSGTGLPIHINDNGIAANGLPPPISVAASESGPGAIAARAGPPLSPAAARTTDGDHDHNGVPAIGHSSSGRRRTLVLVPLNRVGSIPLQVVNGATGVGGDGNPSSPNGRAPILGRSPTRDPTIASSPMGIDRRRTMDRDRDGALFEAQLARRKAAAMANSPGGAVTAGNGSTTTAAADTSSPTNSARAIRRSTMERGVVMNVKRASGGPLADGTNATSLAAANAAASQRRTQRIIDIAIASAASIQALAETLSSSAHANLQRIRFTRSSGPTTLPPSSYHSEAIGSIIMALPRAPHVTSLDLTDIASQVAVSKLASIIGKTNLMDVTIRVQLEPKYLALSEKSADEVARFKDNSGAYQFCESIAAATRLVKLNISQSQIGPIAGDALATSVKHHASLTLLNLSSTVLGNVAAIEDMLTDNSTLLHLDLSSNSFGEAGGRRLVGAIGSNASLVSLRLEHNGFNATTAALIIGAVKNHRTLRDFSIAHNPLGPDFGKVLSHLLTSNTILQQLDLSATSMETKGAEVFSMALEKNRTLTSLSLAGNDLTHMGGRYISDSLLRNPTNSLVYIDLRHNQIAHHNQVSSLLKGCTGIITCFSVAGNLFKDGTEAKLNKLIRANRANALHHIRECRLAFCMGMQPRLGRKSSITTFRTSPMYYSKVMTTLFEFLPIMDLEAPAEPDDEWHEDPEREPVRVTRTKSIHRTAANDREDSDSLNGNNNGSGATAATAGNATISGSTGVPASVARLRMRHSRTRTLEDLPITGASTLAPLSLSLITSVSPGGTVHRSLAGFSASRGSDAMPVNGRPGGHDDAPIGFTPTKSSRAAAIISSSTRPSSRGRSPAATQSTATTGSDELAAGHDHDDTSADIRRSVADATRTAATGGGGGGGRPRTRAGRLDDGNSDNNSEPRTPKGNKIATRASVLSNDDTPTRPVTRGGTSGGTPPVTSDDKKKKPRDMSKRRTMEARLPRPMAMRNATDMIAAAAASGSVYAKK